MSAWIRKVRGVGRGVYGDPERNICVEYEEDCKWTCDKFGCLYGQAESDPLTGHIWNIPGEAKLCMCSSCPVEEFQEYPDESYYLYATTTGVNERNWATPTAGDYVVPDPEYAQADNEVIDSQNILAQMRTSKDPDVFVMIEGIGMTLIALALINVS